MLFQHSGHQGDVISDEVEARVADEDAHEDVEPPGPVGRGNLFLGKGSCWAGGAEPAEPLTAHDESPFAEGRRCLWCNLCGWLGWQADSFIVSAVSLQRLYPLLTGC